MQCMIFSRKKKSMFTSHLKMDLFLAWGRKKYPGCFTWISRIPISLNNSPYCLKHSPIFTEMPSLARYHMRTVTFMAVPAHPTRFFWKIKWVSSMYRRGPTLHQHGAFLSILSQPSDCPGPTPSVHTMQGTSVLSHWKEWADSKVSERCHLSPNGQPRTTVPATADDRNMTQGLEATANKTPTPAGLPLSMTMKENKIRALQDFILKQAYIFVLSTSLSSLPYKWPSFFASLVSGFCEAESEGWAGEKQDSGLGLGKTVNQYVKAKRYKNEELLCSPGVCENERGRETLRKVSKDCEVDCGVKSHNNRKIQVPSEEWVRFEWLLNYLWRFDCVFLADTRANTGLHEAVVFL